MKAELSNAVTFAQVRRNKRARPRQKRERAINDIVKPILPTPERVAKGHAEMADVHHYESATKTQAAQFVSWHTTMHKRGAINDDQFKIITKYVDQWQICERSPLKSNLNREKSGGEYNPLKFLKARELINHWNARIGRTGAREFVLVACDGLGYKGAAIALFGENTGRHDEERIKRHFIRSLEILDAIMD